MTKIQSNLDHLEALVNRCLASSNNPSAVDVLDNLDDALGAELDQAERDQDRIKKIEELIRRVSGAKTPASGKRGQIVIG